MAEGEVKQMVERKAMRAGSWFGFEVSHPSDKNNDVARMGHPAPAVGEKEANAGPSTSLRFAQDDSIKLECASWGQGT